jgi:DNA-directed RNA polymerase I, II, and III subunit RPABC1
MAARVIENSLYVARLHAGEMLHDRGYSINMDVVNIPFDEFKTREAERDLDLYATRPVAGSDELDRIYVCFYPTKAKKLTPVLIEKELNQVALKLDGQDAYSGAFGIVVVSVETPAQAMYHYLKSDPRFRRVELVSVDFLQLNPTKHVLVPRHEVVPKAEEENLLRVYNVQRSALAREFPRILVTDPVVRWLGIPSGRIVRITRPSEQTGRSTIYRVVVG